MVSKLSPFVSWLAFSLILAVSPPAQADTVLVELGDIWKYFKGTRAPSNPPTAWREQGFDDSNPLLWLSGASGIGYGDGDDATELTDMEDGYLSLYTRRIFTVPDPSAVRNLLFSVDYDDGFIAWLNGAEIARREMGAIGEEFAFDRAADEDHEAGVPELIDVSEKIPSLVPGTNTLAIQVHNWEIGSSDLTLRPRLIANSPILEAPFDLTCTPQDADQDGRTDRIALSWTNRAAYDSIRIERNGAPLGDPLPGDATSFVDSAPDPLDDSYQVIATLRGVDCPPLACAVILCEAIELSCVLSLQGGTTIATLGWSPLPPGMESIEVLREGARLATLAGTETGFIDPNVESIELEDDTDYSVVFRRGGRSCTISTGILSLCPGLDARPVELYWTTRIRLTWDNVVRRWESFTILRDGAVIASGLPGNSRKFIDESIALTPGMRITYTLRPIAPAGRQVSCDRTASVTLTELPIATPWQGWDYIYDAEDPFGGPQDLYEPERLVPGNLDGRWIRAANDSWDGSAPGDTAPPPGGPAPGGIRVVGLPGSGNHPCGQDLKVLEIADPGNPSGYGEPNNSVILLGVDAGSPGRNLLRDGVTLAARWRLTPNPIDVGNPGANGDGETLANSLGLGQIGFYFRNDGSPALAGQGASAGYAIALDSASGMEFGTAAPTTYTGIGGTRFRTVWVSIYDWQGDGTYDVQVYLNGFPQPIASLSGSGLLLGSAVPDLGPGVVNSLAIGLPASQDDGSIQIDFVAWKRGAYSPYGGGCPPLNHPPVARIALQPSSGDVTIAGGTARVVLSGFDSEDGDEGSQGLMYSWSVVQGPGSARIEDPAAAVTEAVFTEPGAYQVELTVDDGQPMSATNSRRAAILVRPENHPPVARIAIVPPGGTVTLEGGTARVELDGSLSDDGDGGAQGLAFRWSQVYGPQASTVRSPDADRTFVDFGADGVYIIELTVDDGQSWNHAGVASATITVEKEPLPFRRGNWVNDGRVDIADAIGIVFYIFLGDLDKGCLDSGDADDSGALDIGDPVRLLSWLFLDAEEPPAPGPYACGPDTVADDLEDCRSECR